MKKTIILGIFTLFIGLVSNAQTSYKDWKKQKDKAYENWQGNQNWQKKYFVWQQKADADFKRWKKENDLDENDTKNNDWLHTPPSKKNTGIYPDKKLAILDDRDAKTSDAPKKTQKTDENNRKANVKYNTDDVAVVKPTVLSDVKIWVVIVGVADYTQKKSKLKYADDDAYKIYGFFKSPEGGAVPEKRIALLIDEEANGKKIKVQLKSFSEKAAEDDVLLFYFSGHGVPNARLGVDFHENDQSVIAHQFLKSTLENSNAKYKYCIIDACHSGSLSKEKNESFYTDLKTQKSNFISILSSKGEETSLEASGKRQGVFSYFFIKGLYGAADYNQDKVIGITELFDFTRKKVKQYTHNKQTPIITGDYKHRMPIALIR